MGSAQFNSKHVKITLCQVTIDIVTALNNNHHVCVCVCFSWIAYEGGQFTENMYLLEEGEYPNTELMGLLSSETTIRSIHTAGHVSVKHHLQS